MNIFKKLWLFVCLETKGLLSDLISGKPDGNRKGQSVLGLCHSLGSSYGYFFYPSRINRGGI
jgi:hypothetical protein